MKKLALFGLLMAYGLINVHAQLDAVLEAPTNAAMVISLASIDVSTQLMNKAQEKLKEEAKEMTSKNFAQNMQTLKEIMALMEKMICANNELSITLNAYGPASCMIDLRVQKTIANMQMGSEFTYAAFGVKTIWRMTQSEQAGTLKDVLNNLEKSIDEIRSLNGDITSLLVERAKTKYINKNFYNLARGYSISRY